MRRIYSKRTPRKNFFLTVVDDNTIRVKTTKISTSDLNVVKKACHVTDRRKTFDIARVDARNLNSFSERFTIEPIPSYVTKLFHVKEHDVFSRDKIPSALWESLYEYQKEGVKMAFDRYNGRCLMADDMGLGKTRQGLCFIGHCQPSRTLIICPSYLRYHWKHELYEWLGIEAQLVKKGSEPLEADTCIVSYDMLVSLQIPSGLFKTVVCDESHYVKSRKAKRTKAVTPLVHAARHTMLITGTPALNRPIELFSQLYMLRPAYVKNYTSYAKRYCNGKPTPFGFDDRGVSNPWELHWLLKKGFMVRRLKRDVLTQLPPKTRHCHWLDVKADQLKDVESGFRKWKQLNQTIYKLPSGSEMQRKQIFERQTVISELMRATAAAKCTAVTHWVMERLQQGHSFIFFAYHQVVLNAVEEAVAAASFSYMRIDGSTPAATRQANVEAFQSNPDMRIAILSIMAAGTGVTLTRVSECVFGELYWVPGVIIQAEDRVHRISQTARVDIRYLLGQDTLDTYVHPSLCKKLSILDDLVDQRADRTLGSTKQTEDEEDSILKIITQLSF